MVSTDEQLVSAYLSGDTDAMSQLIEQNIKAIYNFAYRIVGNSQDAEDVTQETFIKVWKNIKRYKICQSFRAWLFTIERNTAYDKLRKKKSLVFSDFENAEGENALLDTLADPEPPPDEIIEALEKKNAVENILHQVPFLYREVLLLRYNENFTFKEIGAILKKPLDTVKSQHRRGLILFKKLLDTEK